jgi:hypothetical protein
MTTHKKRMPSQQGGRLTQKLSTSFKQSAAIESLCGGFGDEETAEAVVDELDADDAFTGFAVAHVDDAALGGEIVFLLFAACTGLRERDADVEVGTDSYVKAGAESGAATAKILAGCGFFEFRAAGVNATDGNRQAHGNAALCAWARGG